MISGLRPLRLLAQVVNDELELYENRVAKTLIDNLDKHISDKRKKVEDEYHKASQAIAWERYSNQLSDYRRYDMLQLLLPSAEFRDISGHFTSVNILRERVRLMQFILMQCRESRFYQALIRCRSVGSPLMATNILTKDTNYHVLFNLWQVLESNTPVAEEALGDELPPDLAHAYGDYCQIMLAMALKTSGFKPVRPSIAVYTDRRHISLRACFERGRWRVTLSSIAPTEETTAIVMRFEKRILRHETIPIQVTPPTADMLGKFKSICQVEGDQFILKDIPTEEQWRELGQLWHADVRMHRQREAQSKQHQSSNQAELLRRDKSWSHFIEGFRRTIPNQLFYDIHLLPMLTDFGRDEEEISKHIDSLLEAAGASTNQHGIRSTLILHPLAVNKLPETLPESYFQRCNTQGDNYYEEDAQKWGEYRAGLLPISPFQLNSLLRLVRLCNLNTIGRDVMDAGVTDTCLLCESEGQIHTRNDGSYQCYSCKCEWGVTECPSCSYRFPWFRPSITHPLIDTSTFTGWMEALETLGGRVALSALCMPPGGVLEKSFICPKCGRCQHATKRCDGCPRYPVATDNKPAMIQYV